MIKEIKYIQTFVYENAKNNYDVVGPNQLEIVDSKILLQPSYPKKDVFVVGIVSSYEEALGYVENIVREVYESTGKADIRNYILKKEQED